MGTRRRNLFHSALIKRPSACRLTGKSTIRGGFRGPIATRVNKPENDDPSIVEPIEITTPLAHSQYAKNGKTLTMPRKERAQRGVRRPHARAYSRTLYEGSRYGAHYTAKIKCVGSGMLTKFDPRPNESQQFKLPKSLSSKARRVQYH